MDGSRRALQVLRVTRIPFLRRCVELNYPKRVPLSDLAMSVFQRSINSEIARVSFMHIVVDFLSGLSASDVQSFSMLELLRQAWLACYKTRSSYARLFTYGMGDEATRMKYKQVTDQLDGMKSKLKIDDITLVD